MSVGKGGVLTISLCVHSYFSFCIIWCENFRQLTTPQHTVHHFKFNQYGTDQYLGVFLVVFHYYHVKKELISIKRVVTFC